MFFDAVNAHDEQRFLDAFTSDGAVDDWRSTHANGRSAFTFDVAGDQIAKMTIREG